MIGLLTSRVGRYLALAGGILLAILTFGASQRRAGAQRAKQKAMEADHEHAEEIRDRKDDALRRLDGDTRDADEQLRGLGGLRDD